MKTEKAGLPGVKMGLAKKFTVSQRRGRAFTNAFATFPGAAGGFTNVFATFSGAAGGFTNAFATFPAALADLQTCLQRSPARLAGLQTCLQRSQRGWEAYKRLCKAPQRSRLARKMGLSGSAGMRVNLFF